MLIAFFNESEIVTGDKVGNCRSYDLLEIVEFRQLRRIRAMLGDDVGFVRDFLARNVSHSKTLNSRYVVKVPRISSEQTMSTLEAKRKDLATETFVLRALSHPNIIKLKGLPIEHYQDENFSSNMILSKSSCSFLMMEKMHQMLQDRIKFWKRAYRRVMKPELRMVINRRGLEQKKVLIEQLKAAVELASALEYLHINKYLHGSLVPSNIGFNNSGNLVLFNFDHSVPPNSTIPRNIDIMNEAIQNLRYHCPSVIDGGTYKESSEIYSFAMILYEILSLKQPLLSNTIEEFRDCMVKYRNRPQIPETWPLGIQVSISKSWNTNELKRPSMMDIHKILQQELKYAANGRITSSSSVQISRFQRLSHDIVHVQSSDNQVLNNRFKGSDKEPSQTRYTHSIYKTPAA
jgi:serine/threonine protein kinase